MTRNRRFKLTGGLRLFAVAIAMVSSFYAGAQEKHRVFNLSATQKFLTETTINSNTTVQRGMQRLEVNSTSKVAKEYKVVSKDTGGYQLSVQITQMDNQINAMGKKFHYSSNGNTAQGSGIGKALNYIENKPIEVYINKFGVVQKYSAQKAEMATDTLVDFAGIQPLIFEKGVLLNFLADFTYNKGMKKGYIWTDDVQIGLQKLHTEFIIADVTEKNTVVRFYTEIRDKLINTNINGTYIIDNASSVVVEKLAYMLSRGYEISAGKIMYEVARSSSIVEKTKQIP